MKKILITGGAGFIGSHLCDALIKKGYKVICVDNLLTGSEVNIAHLKGNENFEFIEKDVVKNEINVDDLDYIFHLASPASPADFSKLSEEIALANSLGTIKMLELANANEAKILIASTSEVYGDPLEHPQKESYWGNVNSFGPRACYDESKRFAETMSFIYLKKYDLDVRIVRIFNTYGPRMRKDDGRAVSNFINRALEGKPLQIHGDGKITRSFCYYQDLVKGIEKALFVEDTKGEVINLGNLEEYSIVDFAKKIIKLTKSKSKIVYKPAAPDDPKKRKPDITKAKNLLNWKPKVGLDEGLKKTIAYNQKQGD